MLQRALAGILRLVAVNGVGHLTPVLRQMLGHLVGAMLGAGEDDHPVHRQILQQLAQQLALLHASAR